MPRAVRTRTNRAFEWPTFAVAIVIYAGFGAVTWYHAALGWLLPVAGGYLVAWHGSLQHEVVHGHPTRHKWLNRLLVAPALGLWLPFNLYRSSHLRHHRAAILADPAVDSESFYLPASSVVARHPLLRALASAHNTLLGRLLLGPLLLVSRALLEAGRGIASGDRHVLRAWLIHLPCCALVLGWVVGVCEMNPWLYLGAIAYPGLALTLLRSFAEHQASAHAGGRTAVVEASAPLALLFLNNNLHVTHHARPGCPWYRLPALWVGEREQLLERHPELVHAGYGSLARRFALRPKERLVYQLD